MSSHTKSWCFVISYNKHSATVSFLAMARVVQKNSRSFMAMARVAQEKSWTMSNQALKIIYCTRLFLKFICWVSSSICFAFDWSSFHQITFSQSEWHNIAWFVSCAWRSLLNSDFKISCVQVWLHNYQTLLPAHNMYVTNEP